MTDEKPKVAIVGGGIGGVFLAVALARAGIKVDLFEQAPKFAEIGAGVGLGPNTVRAIKLLGLFDFYKAVADHRWADEQPGEHWEYWVHWQTGEVKSETRSYAEYAPTTVHRARLLDGMVSLMNENVVSHFGHRFISAKNIDEQVELILENMAGENVKFSADILVGCDGVKSAVRTCLKSLPKEPRIRYTGTYAYRGLLSAEKAVPLCGNAIMSPRMWLGPSKHALVFPIESGKVINLVAFVSDRRNDLDERLWEHPAWVQPAKVEDLLADFKDWDPDLINLLKLVQKPDRWALHELVPLDSWTDNRITLLGDSAHAATPHNGAMAGQCIEDVYILSALLSRSECTKANVPAFLKAYEKARIPRASRLQSHSRESGELYEYASPSAGHDWDKMSADLTTRMAWIWEHKIEVDLELALNDLKQQGLLKA